MAETNTKDYLVGEDELKKQKEYCKTARAILDSRYPGGHRAFVHIYGCQQNVSDGERLKGLLAEMGYSFTDDVDDADLVLYDTCAVREHAEDRVYGNIGALKAHKTARPDAIIVLCGCMMQQKSVAERIKKSYPYVNIVFGTHSSYRLPEFICAVLNGSKRIFDLSENDRDVSENTPVYRDSAVKGWLPIMYGCNNFCTYCIVPYVRGRERSRNPEAIIAEAKQMISSGIKDITLLGQNVNSYGKGCDFNVDFADLLRMINALDGDFIIRFMTSHPKDCNEKLLDAMRDCDKVAQHLHLPVQSGSSRVLKAMNRGYSR
ncbi:MAG: MiaB/RimO family radical SAM methylthiotransferase, partial [Acutalibacteraceae bacterium]